MSTQAQAGLGPGNLSPEKPKMLLVVNVDLGPDGSKAQMLTPVLTLRGCPAVKLLLPPQSRPCLHHNPNTFIPESPAGLSAWDVWMTCPALSVQKLCHLALHHLHFQPSRRLPLISKVRDIICQWGPEGLGISRCQQWGGGKQASGSPAGIGPVATRLPGLYSHTSSGVQGWGTKLCGLQDAVRKRRKEEWREREKIQGPRKRPCP